MARAVSLGTIRDRIRRRADIMSETDRFPDAELNDDANEGLSQFHAEMVRVKGQGFQASDTFIATAGGQEKYSLPAQLLELTKVWLVIDGYEIVLRTYE